MYLYFRDELVSLSMMSSGFIHVVACGRIPPYAYAPLYSPVHPWRGLGPVHLSTVVNNTAMNGSVQISLQDPLFHSFGYTPRSGIVELYDNFIFNFLRICHTVF